MRHLLGAVGRVDGKRCVMQRDVDVLRSGSNGGEMDRWG
jgi:hypothetical protein